MQKLKDSEVQTKRTGDLALHIQQLATLHSMATRVSDSADPKAIADVALDHVLRLLGLEAGAVFLTDEKTGRLQLEAHRCLPKKFTKFMGDARGLTPTEAAEFGLGAEVDGRVRVEPVSRYPRLARLLSEGEALSTLINVPLSISDQPLGSLVVFCDREPPLEAEQAALLDVAAGEIATLVKHARLLAAERRQRRLAETLREVANDLASNRDRQTTLSSILEHLSRVMEYDGAAVLLMQGELLKTVTARGFGSAEAVHKILQVSLAPDDHPYLRRIIREGRPFRFPPEHRQDPFRGVLAMETIHSTMAAPLKTKDGVIGVLTVHKIDPDWYDEADLAALEAFGSHAALAIQNAELWTELKALSAQSVEALERERRRISRELHDEVGQALTVTRISLEMALRDVPAELAEVRSRLEGVVTLATQTLNDVRRLAYDLRPMVLDDLGLVSALQWYTDAFSRRTGLPVSFRAGGLLERPPADGAPDNALARDPLPEAAQARLSDGQGTDASPGRPSPGLAGTGWPRSPDRSVSGTGQGQAWERAGASEVETVLYRLVQEGLTNIVRHADAQHVEIELTGEPEAISLRIRDDGQGFDAARLSKPWSPGQGLGLRGMRERVKLLGGTLEVISKPGKGAELRARVPLQPRRDT